MENFSTTQATNITALCGMVVMILHYFKINVVQGDLEGIIGAGITIYGIIANYVHRYKEGDLTLGGFRK